MMKRVVLFLALGFHMLCPSRADEIGGRSYGETDLGLGGNYSFQPGPPTNVHAWTGSNVWTTGDVSIDPGTDPTVLDIAAGSTVTYQPVSGPLKYNQTGTFRISGTFMHNSTYRLENNHGVWKTFETVDGGIFDFRTDSDHGLWDWSHIIVRSGGTLRKSGGTGTSRIIGDHGGSDINFETGSMIDVLQGRLTIRTASKTLIDGTDAGTHTSLTVNVAIRNSSMLTVYGAPEFTTIDDNTTLLLGGSNPRFMDNAGTDSRLDKLVRVDGTLALHDGHQFSLTPSGPFAVTSTAALEFGLHAADYESASAPNGLTTNAMLDIDGDVNLAAGTEVDIVNNGGFTVGEYLLIRASGTITDGGASVGAIPPEAKTLRLRLELRDSATRLVLMVTHPGTVMIVY